ncbi:winged helix DNA-binding domain-containing protein [Actinomycetospora endophytica]|uniref:Winged helix DNA-binding domain-containing protein n=1 Tax=Actinomycetospora endophytica TaxID=2291215 RepID=A0ABS8P717_9PSEU|nr:winged helix DNA-binding domain-containing protein [Actinomycetospora endophytica]MCD2194056.1 winged helix DNA-binding domain-containing protein [Actinomycetospora endophytica]
MDVSRERAIAFRIAAQGLGRVDDDDGAAAVLALGVQHLGPAAAIALAARLPGAPETPAERGLELAWTHRGAPHWHGAGSLRSWADALRPLDDDDAAARLNWSGPGVERTGTTPLAAIDTVAGALADVVRDPMTKGEVSGAVSAVLPRALQYDCVPCGATHVHDQLLRLGAGPAGIGLDASARTLRLTPRPPGWTPPSGPGSPAAVARLVTAAVRVLGPVTTADLAAWVGTGAGPLRPAVDAAGLAEVTVEGRRAWVAPDRLDLLTDPPTPPRLRLLPPFDPLLAGRDRALLVPETGRRRTLWPSLGHPGAVLADGEVVGTWRPQASGRTLTLAVTAFDDGSWSGLDEEAERVAAARGLRLADVRTGSS